MQADKSLTKLIIALAFITAFLLLIPLIAMQFTDEVVWTLSDFVFAGGLIFGTGLTYKLVTRRAGETVYRAAVGSALAAGFMLIWANGAVGIVGSESHVFNLWYYAVIAVGLIGAFVSRFSSMGMMFTMFAMAAAQALLAVAALISGMANIPESSVLEILGVNGFFIVLFSVSALLFRYSAQQKTGRD